MGWIARLLIAAGVAGAALSPLAAAPRQDWSQSARLSPLGGHLIGDPQAAHHIVQYVSYTCSHCADFERQGTVPLMAGWVRPGAASLEIRSLVRDRYDLTAALLARCGGPTKFLGNHRAIFARYDVWMDKVRAYDASDPRTQKDRFAQIRDIAEKTGLAALMRGRGYTGAQVAACLNDKVALQTLLDTSADATRNVGVTGTPSFLIDGRLAPAHDWMSLAPLLPGSSPAKTS